jgi:hypothetical protein
MIADAAPMLPPSTDLEPEAAAELLANWGFIAHSGLPDHPGPGYLMVALRRLPTLAHYDPETLEFWITRDGRGVPASIDHQTPMPHECEVSWGTVRIVDRLRKPNEFLTFGGALTASRVEGATVAVLLSPAPLLSRGGHSQGWDAGARELAAWFGRLWGAAGNARGFEAGLAAADPLARYAAFIAELRARDGAHAPPAGAVNGRWHAWEQQRLRRDHPAAWLAGLDLRQQLAIATRGSQGGGSP